MTVIDVTPVTETQPAAPRPDRRRYSALVVGLVAAVGLLSGLLIGTVRPHSQPPAKTYTVEVGLSEYPAPVVAAWWDRAGHRGTLDPWIGKSVRLQATRVVVAVAYTDGPVQCTVIIDGVTVDSQAATAPGQTALCAWAA